MFGVGEKHNHRRVKVRYGGVSFNEHDDSPRLFSSRKPILDADDEMWLYPCRNPDRPDAKEIRRLLIKWGIYEDED